jgi:hypothetical protein
MTGIIYELYRNIKFVINTIFIRYLKIYLCVKIFFNKISKKIMTANSINFSPTVNL